MKIRVVELFAGIGAQRMALDMAGIDHEVVAIAEIDKHALASYRAIYGDCPNMGDITKIERLPPCDLVTYSFPCQDLSLAGKRKGMGEGTRSGLVWEVVRLLEGAEEKPEWLLMENVKQVLTAPEWPSLVKRLENMGYRNKWAKIDSSEFGSAQKRVRAFMVSRLGQEPPDLPTCDPNAPARVLRDIMEPTRDEKYVRRIPLERIRWRKPKEGYSHPQSTGIECPLIDASDSRLESRRIASEESLCPTLTRGTAQKVVSSEEAEWVRPLVEEADCLRMAPSGEIGTVKDGRMRIVTSPEAMRKKETSSTPAASIDGETFYSKAMIYSPDLCAPTVRTEHGLNCQIKVFGCDDGKGNIDQNIVPSRTFLNRRYYEEDGSSPCVVASSQGRIKVVADFEGKEWKMWRRLYSDESLSPTVPHRLNNQQTSIKVVAEWEREGRIDMAGRIYENDGLSPAMVCHGGGDRDVKVISSEALGLTEDVPAMREGDVCPVLTPERVKRQHGPRYRDPNTAAFTVTCQDHHGGAYIEDGNLLVNTLTPKEAWRLMGFPDWAYERASKVSSETQLYNQAGNSIVVEVLMAIFRAMFEEKRAGTPRQTSICEWQES